MREMFLDFALMPTQVVVDVLVIDKEEMKMSRDEIEYMSIDRAIEDVVAVIQNVSVDKVYCDSSGVSAMVIDAIDKELTERKLSVPVLSVKHVSSQTMYRPKEVKHGHQTDSIFRY